MKIIQSGIAMRRYLFFMHLGIKNLASQQRYRLIGKVQDIDFKSYSYKICCVECIWYKERGLVFVSQKEEAAKSLYYFISFLFPVTI